MRKDLCVLWEPDADSAARLEALARAASGSAFLCTAFHPHITLGCYLDIQEEALAAYMREFAKQVSPFPLAFEEIGLLTPTVAACFPACVGGLRQHHQAFHQRYDEYADRWTSLSGGLYTPHVSLYTGPGEVDADALRRLSRAFTPFCGTARVLALSWIKGEEDYEILLRVPLGESLND